MASGTDYYAVLGVSRSADIAEIRRAYKEQALLHHPDKNQNCIEEATRRFKLIAEAYSVLKDPQQRAAYDAGAVGGWTTSSPFDSDADSGFNIGKARDLFQEVFGDEFTAMLAQQASAIAPHVQAAGRAVAPHVKAAAEATVSGLTLAAEAAGRTRMVRSSVAAQLSKLTDEAASEVASKVSEEVVLRQAMEAQLLELEKHQASVAAVLQARKERRVSWWQSLRELATREQQYADGEFDFLAAEEKVRLVEGLREAEAAWRRSCRELACAQAVVARAQQEEEEVQRNGASLKHAAIAGAAFEFCAIYWSVRTWLFLLVPNCTPASCTRAPKVTVLLDCTSKPCPLFQPVHTSSAA